LEAVHSLQDAIKVDQPGGPGKFEVPNWDQASQKTVREALLTLASTLPDTKRMFGPKEAVDPVRRLIGAAILRRTRSISTLLLQRTTAKRCINST
jgi:hypothetical protein